MTTLYIAGPMSGLPDNNYAAFREAEEKLRGVGYEVLNPVINPGPSYQDFMRQGFRQLLDAEGVALLDGWERSPGAVQERTIALWLKIECASLGNWLTLDTIQQTIEAGR